MLRYKSLWANSSQNVSTYNALLMLKYQLPKQGAATSGVVVTAVCLSLWNSGSLTAIYTLQSAGNTNIHPIPQFNFVFCCLSKMFSPPPSSRR